MTYQEQLNDKRWKIRAIRFKGLKNMTCEFCGAKKWDFKFLHIHHKVYKNNLMAWEYLDEDLICLCNDCHRKVHYSLINERRNEEKINNMKISEIFKKMINE